MARKFTALRVIGTIFKVIGWLVLILGLLGAILALVLGFLGGTSLDALGMDLGPLTGVAAFLAGVLASVLYFLLFYAIGEYIYLFLSIEENTRRTAYLLYQQFHGQPPEYGTPPSQPGYDD
jgi:peptidoglycan/LPS O-acetylase OafA/YrhL